MWINYLPIIFLCKYIPSLSESLFQELRGHSENVMIFLVSYKHLYVISWKNRRNMNVSCPSKTSRNYQFIFWSAFLFYMMLKILYRIIATFAKCRNFLVFVIFCIFPNFDPSSNVTETFQSSPKSLTFEKISGVKKNFNKV